MSNRSTPSKKERIIPIQLEYDLEASSENQSDTSRKDTSFTSDDSGGQNENSDTPSTSASEISIGISNTSFKRTLPYSNAKEKIIIVIDTAEDESCTPFKLNNNALKPLDMIKRGVEFFLHHKHRISRRKDEFALVILNENDAIWVLDFTSNISDVINSLENVKVCEAEDVFDLDNLFDVILEHVDVPDVSLVDEVPISPLYVVRSVLFYARSYTVPKISDSAKVLKLLEAPFYTFDVVMTHEPFDIDNNCGKISDILQTVDKKGFAYFFPVARDAKTLFNSVGKLLGHPLQRPPQKLVNNNLRHYTEKYM